MESSHTTPQECMKEAGSKTRGTALASKGSATETSTRESTVKEKSMDKANTFGPVESTMKDNGVWEIRTATVFGRASLATPISANGETTSHTALESISGATVTSMKANGKHV